MSIEPHGGKLINRCVDDEERAGLVIEAASLPRIDLDDRQVSDLDMIAVGAMSPLTGFMGEADYRSVVDHIRLADGTVWPFPMGLRVSREVADSVTGARAALHGPDGTLLAVMDVTEKYQTDKKDEAARVFGMIDDAHPGVAALYAQGDVSLAGDIHMVGRRGADFPALHADPADLRARFEGLGWKTIVGFQTRNPIHRAHEYLLKCALEIVDGVLIHPLVGATKSDDIPADIRVQCYEVLLDQYFPKNRAVLAVYPAAMRYAGPREAIFHAITRKNYGCTHFIVGRDHAGVGSYYGTFDAQKIFERFTAEELGITIFKFEHAFWCKRSGGMATDKTSDSASEERFILSGTKVREMLNNGDEIPVEFARPEVARILIANARLAKVSA